MGKLRSRSHRSFPQPAAAHSISQTSSWPGPGCSTSSLANGRGCCTADPSQRSRILFEARNHQSTYNYRLWGFATAQHYGVPSVGLDITHDVRVALFFALHRFTTDKATGTTTMARRHSGRQPHHLRNGRFPKRPFRRRKAVAGLASMCATQGAGGDILQHRMGSAQNKAADRIYMALRLVGHTRWPSPFTCRAIFPDPTQDTFLAFLLEARDRYDIPGVREILNFIYFVP